jgi:NADH-quinone oxidoreductase subunit L
MSPIALILAFPLLGFLINGLLGPKLPKSIVGWLGTLAVFASFIFAVSLWSLISADAKGINWNAYTFLQIEQLTLNVSFTLDRLSLWMTLIITGIGSLIHLYSISYMDHDEQPAKFFAYLNLFIFSMLLLVLGSNLLMLFFGWEGVGLCSYLLIGFWYANKDFGHAARKAFVMNRIGDLGLLLGMYLIASNYGSLEYSEVLPSMAQGNGGVALLTGIAVLLFIGAIGKSAQVPLFTWLPDAMAGPTPVSALIHAATMVTAGIYLVVRTQALFFLSPAARTVVLVIGVLTALIAAVIALRQNDIKKVLAYSTVSQLGFMFVALGVGAYTTALFHVTTHAFFKALLFLGAGSVIHGVQDEQDMRYLGGLKSKMPITYWTFLLGTLAISGFPLLSGFFSKDEILANIFHHSALVYGVMAFAALLTSVYMFRLLFLTFHGEYRGAEKLAFEKVHESNWKMTTPLIILAVLSVLGGLLNLPHYISHEGFLLAWLKPTYIMFEEIVHAEMATEILLISMAVLIFLGGFIYSRQRYLVKGVSPEVETKGVAKWMQNKLYIDEFYNLAVVKPLEVIGDILFALFDTFLLYGLTFAIHPFLIWVGGRNRKIQNGNIEFYLLYMVVAIAILLGVNLLFVLWS